MAERVTICLAVQGTAGQRQRRLCLRRRRPCAPAGGGGRGDAALAASLDRPLSLAKTGDGVELLDGEALVASGRSVPADGLAPPVTVTLDQAEASRGLPDADAAPLPDLLRLRPAGGGRPRRHLRPRS